MKTLFLETKFLIQMWKYSLASALQYKSSFIAQIVGMLLNDFIYLVYWFIFFNKFHSISDYDFSDMLIQFSVVTSAFGIAFSLFGNTFSLSQVINQGSLDHYLTLPKNALLHIIAANFSIVALGDLLCGSIVFFAVGNGNFSSILLWICCSLLVAIIFIMFNVFLGTLSFWLGNSNGFSSIINEILVTFSLYPNNIFKGFVKILTVTIIPSTFIGVVPVQIIADGNIKALLILLGYTVFITSIALISFYLGLKRYSSSNMISIKG
ncbi:ABC-2 family transporter protein [Paenibacillus sp. T2-29]|uniref:ABC-2 family transporter protein n=1 Tax=Paenibacillus TaxID=44249 RepID=UPI0039BD38CD